MSRARSIVAAIVTVSLAAALGAFFGTLGGCTLSQAVAGSYKGLTVAEGIVGAATVQFPTLTKAHELAIVAASTNDPDRGRAKIDAWRVTSDRIIKAIEGTDNSIKLARDAIAEIRKGVRDRNQLGGWIATAIRLGIDLKDLLSAAGVPLGGL